MLALVLFVSLAQVPELLTLEVGETRRLSIPGLQRMAVSVSCYDARPVGGGKLDFIGVCEGRSTFLGWLGNGKRVVMDVRIVPATPRPKSVAVPVQQEDAGRSEVSVFTFPEELVEVVDAQELDGGLRLVGRNRAGARLEVIVTPGGRSR